MRDYGNGRDFDQILYVSTHPISTCSVILKALLESKAVVESVTAAKLAVKLKLVSYDYDDIDYDESP